MKSEQLYRISRVRMVAMLMTIVGIVACTTDDLTEGSVKEGTPVTVSFQYAAPAQEMVVSTRSMGDETANKVVNLYVIGFKTNGERAFGFYYEPELEGGKQTTLDAKAKVPAGTYDIYAVANIDSDVYGVDEQTDNTHANNLKSFLDEVTTKEALLSKTVSILTSARNLDRSGASLLMAGALCDNAGNVISAKINTNGQTVSTIHLKRLDSEITFNFKEGADVSFTAQRWYVVNAPAKSRLVEDQTADGATESDDYFNTYREKEEDRTPIYNNTFSFYMPENRKKAKNEQLWSYQEREKEIKNSNGEHNVDPNTQRRNYVYAPDYGTYVVVTGHYEGPGKSSDSAIGSMTNVVAEVRYIIHLGFVNKVANDFFSKRNTKYTYNVTISGVDKIIVEVEQNEEKQPGATGDVIFGEGNNVFTLDAHYETVLLTFYYDELRTAWGNGSIDDDLFTAVASTPYTSMITNNPEEDMKWVQVVRNEGASEDLQYYYGDKSKVQSVQSMLDDLKAAVVNEKPSEVFFPRNQVGWVVTYTCYIDEFYYEQKDLPTGVFEQLPDRINIWKSFVNRPNRKMYIICNRKQSTDKESSIISSKYVLSQRSIQTFYSTEPSNEKVIAYGIETLNETGNLRSYGFAGTDMDNGWANFRATCRAFNWSNVDNGNNGYKSLDFNKRVNDFGNKNPEGGAVDLSYYLRAMTPIAFTDMEGGKVNEMPFTRACMQRNRHEGASEDAIDESDIKWYLPAINQYQSFYLGEPALSQEARLFDYPYSNQAINGNSYQFIKHYAASTYAQGGSANSVFLFWAEEATSVSTKAQQWNWATTGGSKDNPESNLLKRMAFPYRCVRNLGADGENEGGKYTPYRSVVEQPKERVVIKVDKLSPLLKSRGRTTGELGPHFYQDKGNQFYAQGFEVASAAECNQLLTTLERVTGVTAEGGTGCEALNANLQPGEAKWRVPNLRELTLMWQGGIMNDTYNGNQDTGRAASRTQMPYKYSDTQWYRRGWTITNPKDGGVPNIGMSSDTNHATTVRCVRDLK